LKALLLVAHGSRRQESNNEVFALADLLRRSESIQMDIVHTAFLDVAKPSIPEGIAACIRDGARTITLIPYFLNSGRHVVSDIPAIVREASEHHPDVPIRIAPHLGESGLMAGLLIKLVNSLKSHPDHETAVKNRE
jgi:sirohydrochlorin ferrochelatase